MKNTIFYKSILVAIVFFFAIHSKVIAQCPANFTFDNTNDLLAFGSSNTSLDGITLYFDFLGAANDQWTTVSSSPISNNLYYTTIEGSNNSWILDYFTVTFPDGTVCTYQEGQKVGDPVNIDNLTCEQHLQVCVENIRPIVIDALEGYGCSRWNGSCSSKSPNQRNGRVGIGTDDVPGGYRMAVSGKMLVAEKIRVQFCEEGGWCDYVFDEDYDLWSLEKVNEFILKNKHLPNTPSAQQIEKDNGFELKAVALNHQEKIEEVFLHLIELENRKTELEKELERINAENEKLLNE